VYVGLLDLTDVRTVTKLLKRRSSTRSKDRKRLRKNKSSKRLIVKRSRSLFSAENEGPCLHAVKLYLHDMGTENGDKNKEGDRERIDSYITQQNNSKDMKAKIKHVEVVMNKLVPHLDDLELMLERTWIVLEKVKLGKKNVVR